MHLLELEKQRLAAIPPGELDEHEARRMEAAARIQAAWRCMQQRRAGGGAAVSHSDGLLLDPPRCASPLGTPATSTGAAPLEPNPSTAKLQLPHEQSASLTAESSSCSWRRVDHTSSARYQQLMRQVEQRINTHMLAVQLGLHGHAQQRGSIAVGSSLCAAAGSSSRKEAVDQKLQALLEEREAAHSEKLAAVRRRQALLQDAVSSTSG